MRRSHISLSHTPHMCLSAMRDLCVNLGQAVLAARAPDLALEVRVRQGLRDQVTPQPCLIALFWSHARPRVSCTCCAIVIIVYLPRY